MATTASSVNNVSPFPMLECNNLETNNNNYNNNNNHVRAHAWEAILEAYEDVMGRAMPRFVQNEAANMIKHGVEPAMIRAVIEYTACAPRPSWAYARTVIIRNEERGITTASAFSESLGLRGRAGDDDLPY